MHGAGLAVARDLDAEQVGRLPHDRDVVALRVRLEKVDVGGSTLALGETDD